MKRLPRVVRGDETAGGIDPCGHEGELEAYRLVGIPAAVGFPDIGKLVAVMIERCAKRVAKRPNMHAERGESFDKIVERLPVPSQDGITRASCRSQRNVWGDKRISITVTTDPVANA